MQLDSLLGVFNENDTLKNTLFFGVPAVLYVFGLARIFIKAHMAAWPAFIPLYNIIRLLRLVNRPQWWVLLAFIPLVNFIVGLIVGHDLAKSFGKGFWFGLGLAFLSPIFIAILGFGGAQYQGVK